MSKRRTPLILFGTIPATGDLVRWSQPASVTGHIEASSQAVWDVMATPGALARYHPFCASNPVSSWPGVGSRDTIRYLSGLVLHRQFTTWDEGRGYELEIGSAKGPVSRVRWQLVPAGEQASTLTISIWPGAFPGYPYPLRWVLHHLFLLPLLRRYLRCALKGLQYYLTTGRDVRPNQFGRVWYFSSRPPWRGGRRRAHP